MSTEVNPKEQLNLLLTTYEQTMAALRAQASDLLRPIFKDFFEKYPEIKRISWVQYAPYFNDGEACEFSVHNIECFGTESADPEDDDGDDYGDDNLSPYSHAGAKELDDLLQSIPESVMESLYGSDSKVVVTAEGIDVDDYDHE